MKRRPGEEQAIADYTATRAPTIIPPAAAAILGESSPGWRRDVERSVEAHYQRHARDHKGAGHQAGLAARLGANRGLGAAAPKKARPRQTMIMCRFFDKLCIAGRPGRKERLVGLLEYLRKKYAPVGARFWFVEGDAPPTTVSWRATVRPLLDRQLVRRERSA